MTNAVVPGLPPEVRQAHAEKTAAGWSGIIALNYKDGEIISIELTEKKRLQRETHASPAARRPT